MSVKKTVLTLLLTGCMSLTAPLVHAAPDWYACSIAQIGTAPDGRFYIQLTDTIIDGNGDFQNSWWLLPVDREKEMLAIAMTAFVTNVRLSVNLDPLVQHSDVNGIFLLK